MTENQLSPDEQRALAAMCSDHSIARFMAPNFMQHLESLGLIQRRDNAVVVSDEGRRQAEDYRSSNSFRSTLLDTLNTSGLPRLHRR